MGVHMGKHMLRQITNRKQVASAQQRTRDLEWDRCLVRARHEMWPRMGALFRRHTVQTPLSSGFWEAQVSRQGAQAAWVHVGHTCRFCCGCRQMTHSMAGQRLYMSRVFTDVFVKALASCLPWRTWACWTER